MDALRLFRPLPSQSEFFRTASSEVLVRGGNRSGKSTVAAMKFAAIARDMPIILPYGEISQRLPYQKDRPLLMWVIGYQLNHVGATIHRLLFRPGLYKIIRDGKTGEWRSWNPWNPEDLERELECKPSPPLIPASEIENWAWEKRAENQFTLCRLKNGTEIQAYPSTGEPKAGDPVDIIWIDEAIKYPAHVAEWQARLSDRKGRLFWSSWPKASNRALVDMTKRAEKQKDLGEDADVREFVFRFSDNPFIDKNEKRKRLEGWSEDERRTRDSGEYITDNFLVYPGFNRNLHAAITHDADPLTQILRSNGLRPPLDWTRELILDPGTSKPGVLFGAIPPPELGDYRVIYDEIYIQRLDAAALAKLVYQKARGQYFERFIIDVRAARQMPMGFGVTVGSHYSAEFEKLGLRCVQTGSQFTPGSDDVLGRIGAVQEWMNVRRDGTPKLRIVTEVCGNLVEQIENYVKAMEGELVGDKPARGQKDDLVNCLEYWASREPIYVEPPEGGQPLTLVQRALLKWKAKFKEPQGDVHIGPGTYVKQ